jgi:hypothetical protein
MAEADDRRRLIDVARTWIGTPFHDNQGAKGLGCDCAYFLARVAEEAGLVERVEIEPYSPQFMLHSDEEKFEGYLKRYAREIPEDATETGDIVLYRVGQSFAHGAFIIDWPDRIIHAFKIFGCVTESHGREQGLARRQVRFYSFW